MEYVGLKPLRPDEPLIEVESSSGRVYDLYNDWALGAVRLHQSVSFDFQQSEGQGRVRLTFEGLRNLSVTQPNDWDVQEAGQIDHLLVRSPGSWRGVEFNAGGRRYEFDADRLELLEGTQLE
jgi:hypothetical protein